MAYPIDRNSVAGRTAASVAALQKRLDSLNADQLEGFITRQERADSPLHQKPGLVTGGLSSTGFDEYRTNLNNQGEIAKIKSILSGGSGELNVRAGGSFTEDTNEPPSNPTPDSMKGLGRAAYDPGEINDPTGKMKLAVYNKRMGDLEAGTAQAEAARRRAVVDIDPRAGYIEDQARTTSGLDREGKKAAFEREQVGPDAAAKSTAELASDQAKWNDPSQEWMRRRQEGLLRLPYQERGQTAEEVQRLKGVTAEKVAETTSTGRQNVALINQAAANLRNATNSYNPADPVSMKNYADALAEVNRLKDPGPRTTGPGTTDLTRSFADRNIPIQ